MSEVTKKSDTSSSQMRLLGGTPHIWIHLGERVNELAIMKGSHQMTDLVSHHLGGDRVVGSSDGVQVHHHHDHRPPEEREQFSG